MLSNGPGLSHITSKALLLTNNQISLEIQHQLNVLALSVLMTMNSRMKN